MITLLDKLSHVFGVPKPMPVVEKLARVFSGKPIHFTPRQPRSWSLVDENAVRQQHEQAQHPVVSEPEEEEHEHDPHEPGEHDDRCEQCQNAECPECGATYGRDNSPVVESNGNRACTGCTGFCDDCEEHVNPDDLTEVPSRRRRGFGRETRHLCDDCRDGNYFRCADCRDWFSNDDSYGTNTNDEPVCEGCRENYFNCENCNNTFNMDDYGEDGMCQECSDEHDDDNHEANIKRVKEIHSYGYDPSNLVFHGTGRHYGVENEVVMREGDADDLRSKAQKTLRILNRGLPGSEDFAYLKEDSSLHDEGTGSFEIVTHPATLAIQKERWGEYLKSKPSGLISGDTGCCGLHVHVEKKGLSELTIGKMLAFVNAASNKAFVEAIARRSNEHFARLDPEKKVSSVKQPPRSRYEAINLQNPKTVEFRIFKGTLNPKSFVRSLEFVDAVVEFAKPAVHSIQQMHGTDAFFQYVSLNKKRWPLLAEYCKNYADTEYLKERDRLLGAQNASMESAQLSRRGRRSR